MKQRDYRLFIQDILNSIRDAREFVQGMSYEEFLADRKTQHAVVRAIEIIGEAAKNVPQAVRERYPDIPWSDMARMRDKVAHGYWGIDYEIVWRVVQEELPAAEPLLREAHEREQEANP